MLNFHTVTLLQRFLYHIVKRRRMIHRVSNLYTVWKFKTFSDTRFYAKSILTKFEPQEFQFSKLKFECSRDPKPILCILARKTAQIHQYQNSKFDFT